MKTAFLASLILLVSGCGSFKAMNPIDPPKVLAQSPPRHEVSGAVREMTPGVYDLHWEAIWNFSPGFVKVQLPFSVQPGKTLTKVQGLISYNGATECWSQASAFIVFEDVPDSIPWADGWPSTKNPMIPLAAVKANTAGGGSFSTFVSWDIPVPYQTGEGIIFIQNTQNCSGLATLEFDGMMQIK